MSKPVIVLNELTKSYGKHRGIENISALPVPILPNRSAVFLSTPEASPCWPGMCFVVIVAPGSHSPQTARLIPARTIQTAL